MRQKTKMLVAIICVMALMVACAHMDMLTAAKNVALTNKVVWSQVQEAAVNAHISYQMALADGREPVSPCLDTDNWAEFVAISTTVEKAQRAYVDILKLAGAGGAVDSATILQYQLELLQAITTGIELLVNIGVLKEGEIIAG
jgi:hypothetical protein